MNTISILSHCSVSSCASHLVSSKASFINVSIKALMGPSVTIISADKQDNRDNNEMIR